MTTTSGRSVIMDVGFDRMSEVEVIEHILRSLAAGRGGWMVNPNVDVLRQVTRSDELRGLVGTADLVIADGMPVVWASRIAGPRLPERVAGSTLISSLSHAAGLAGLSVFLLGGRPGSALLAADQIRSRTPGVRVATHCPPLGFETDAAAWSELIAAIESFGPAIYYCGFGFPKQERLMAELSVRFRDSWFIGSGASIDFLAGYTRRAPRWVQAAGLEWLLRLVQEPRRLYRRYLIDGLPFAARMLVRTALTAGRRR